MPTQAMENMGLGLRPVYLFRMRKENNTATQDVARRIMFEKTNMKGGLS
jgi:hypothetical protein